MSWAHHTIVQIDSQGIACRFSVRGLGCVHEVIGWVMPDGVGVIQDDGVWSEVEPVRIITDHPEALRRARQGAAEQHITRHVLKYSFTSHGSWMASGNKWVRQSRSVDADVQGELTVHVLFKAGSAELMRFRTEFEADPASSHTNARQGKVGMLLGQGERVLTISGRLTTPFPQIGLETERKSVATLKRVDSWLMQNALAEAQARGDSFNALSFRASLDSPQQSDKDSAEQYLFEAQPPLTPCPMSMLNRLAGSL